MASTQSKSSLKFGIEIECVLLFEPKDEWKTSIRSSTDEWKRKADEVHNALGGIKGGVIRSYVTRQDVGKGAGNEWRFPDPHDNYQRWAIARDEIGAAPTTGYGDFELISPVYEIGRGKNAGLQGVRELWRLLSSRGNTFTVQTSDRCGTHIHISPGEAPKWGLTELRNVALACIHFADTIKAVMPAVRRTGRWVPQSQARDNSESALLGARRRDESAQAHRERLSAVIRASTDVAATMCTRNSTVWKEFVWNFKGVNSTEGKPTIEFRLPPGSRDADDSVTWILFACGFVQAARVNGDSYHSGDEPGLGDLEAHVLKGLEALGLRDRDSEAYMTKLITKREIANSNDWLPMDQAAIDERAKGGV